MLWIKNFVLLGLVVTAFFSGMHYGVGIERGKNDRDRAVASAAALKQEKAYVAQLAQAATQDELNRAVLDRLRSAPRPRILCKRAPALPSLPAAAVPETPPSGELSQGTLFDPTDALYALADRADRAIEDCRAALARWPSQQPEKRP